MHYAPLSQSPIQIDFAWVHSISWGLLTETNYNSGGSRARLDCIYVQADLSVQYTHHIIN